MLFVLFFKDTPLKINTSVLYENTQKRQLERESVKKRMRIPNVTNVYKIYNKYSEGAAAF